MPAIAEDDHGRQVALIGQGYMPVQECHVTRGRGPQVRDGVWFPLPPEPGRALYVPPWGEFFREDARRFPAPSTRLAPRERCRPARRS